MIDLIFKNALVYTMKEKGHTAEAVAVSGRYIVAVGTNDEVMALKEAKTRVIDLAGRMLLPGFIDAHCHPAMCAFFADGILIDEDMDIPQAEACIADFIAKHPDRNAYFGIGYDECLYDEKGPRKEALDKICADKPIMILGSSGHEGWCNSKAFELAGVDCNTPDPVPGFQYFERDQEGNPTGHIVESESESVIFDAIDFFDEQSVYENFIQVSRSYSEMGVTSLVMCGDFDWMEKMSISMVERLVAEGEILQRLQGCVLVNEKSKKEPYLTELKDRAKKYNSDDYRVNVYKILLDGTIETRSASLLEPYDEDGSIVEPLFYGKEFQELCVKVAEAGFDIHVHGIGDRAIREVLKAAKAVRDAGYEDTRITNAHTDFVDVDDIKLFGEYNVIANTTGVWHYGNSDIDKIIGLKRAARQFTMKDIIEGGGRMSLGSDRPVDEYGPQPLNGIEVAVTRKLMDNHDAPVLLPEDQCLTVQQCLEGYTINGAYQMRMEDKTGTIEEGKYADLVVLGKNIFDTPQEEIHKIPVDMTIFNGNIVFQR